MTSRRTGPEVVATGCGWNVFIALDEGVTVYRRGVDEAHPLGRYNECERHGLTGCHHLTAVQRHADQDAAQG